MKQIEVPVLIVGGGPTGLTMALCLARHGVGYRIVERRSGPQRAPAAHAVNARSFEIWRQLGVDSEAIAAAAKDPADAGFVYWVTKLGGEVLGKLPYERQGDDVLEFTPTPLRNLSQHRLEPILVAALGAAERSGLFYQHSWEGGADDGAAILSLVRDHAAGDEYQVRSRYVIAADGAGSRVRKSAGISMQGPDRLQGFLMIHFEADLRFLVGDCPGVLYWTSDPAGPGIFVAHDIDREWVFMQAWDPDSEPITAFDTERCEALVRRAMVPQDVPLTIRNVSPWMMTSQIAERYREGRIFLVGDAAHRFPPTGGLGLNTGVQDAHNLAWKLAMVESDRAGESLLDSYQAERLPVATYNAEQSLQNAARSFEVPQAMGTNREPEEAIRNFEAFLADPEKRREVREVIERQAEHFDMLGLQLGFRYGGAAVVVDGADGPTVANPVREFVPDSRPGSRLPHGWVEVQGRRVSTLDMIQPSEFTAIIGPRGESWREAFGDMRGYPVRMVQIGRDFLDPSDWWSAVAGMDPDGLLLIRPDQHVAFRSRGAGGSPGENLGEALIAILQHPPTRF